ncbi:19779_t:CDS:2, partial [Racocetra persica]
MFRRICEIAAKFYKSMHNDDVACGILTTQLINYKSRDYSFDFGYDSSKTPSLWWGVIKDDYSYLQNLAKAIFVSNNNKLEIGLIVDFSHANFGRQSNAEELSRITQRSGNMEFDPVAIVEREFQFFNDDLL